MAASPVLYVYYPPLNDDSWPGVPNRHITEADWASFTIAQRRTIENATTQEGYTRRKVWVHIDLVDETEEERAQREAEEAAARAEYDRKNSLVRYGQIEAMIDQLEVLPPAEEFATLRADVDAVADVPPRVDAVETQVSAVETKVARVDPGEYAGAVGESLAQGPNGPAWKRDAVSADWFSNPNDAVAAAGIGGIVEFSPGTTYALPEPIRLVPALRVRGGGAFVSRASYATWGQENATTLETNGFPAFVAADPMANNLEIVLSGLVVVGKGTSPVGIDFRGIGHSRIEHVAVREVTDCGIWLGGDSTTHNVSWSNMLVRPFIYVPANGSGIRFSGVTGVGAPTPNNTTVLRAMISFRGDGGKGIDLQAGDTNLVMHSDIGYRRNTIPIYLGDKSRQNTFFRNRMEAVSRSVLIEGGRMNTFIANLLAGDDADISPVVITGSASDNMFFANTYSENARTPRIDTTVLSTKSNDIGERTQFRDNPLFRNGGGVAFEVKADQHAFKTFDVRGDYGVLEWFNRTTGAKIGEFRPYNESGSHFHWLDGMLIKEPKVTALPTASAALRGVTVRVEGGTGVADGLYHCRKKADDTYEWVNLTP